MLTSNVPDVVHYTSTPKLSLCIATMDRWSFLKETIPEYLKNDYIDEIIVSDENGNDCEMIFKTFGSHSKIKLYSNSKRLGAFLNKMKAVSYANNKWICLIDSDNFAPISYFNAAIKHLSDENTVYMPTNQMAYKSNQYFDNREFVDVEIRLDNLCKIFENPRSEVFLQSGNFICTKELFMSTKPIYGLENQCNGLDALFKSILFLKNGATLKGISDMDYFHAVHEGSITLQSFSSDFGINHTLFKNMINGKNPWMLTLRHWIFIEKPMSEWLVNCSEVKGNDDFVPFPIGMSWQISGLKGDLNMLVKNGSHNELVLCALWPSTDERRRSNMTTNRGKILQTLAKNGIQNSFMNYLDYIQKIKNYKFVVSPEGNGVDTHRTYEALLSGCIPIVETNHMMTLKYPNLPILYTSDYSEINHAYLESKWAEMLDKVYDFSPLFLSYYPEHIQNTIKANSDYWCKKVGGNIWQYYT